MTYFLGDEGEEHVTVKSSDRYKITVEFTVPAESPNQAEDLINEIIKDGMLVIASEMEDEGKPIIIDSYDIVDSEPAEIDLSSL